MTARGAIDVHAHFLPHTLTTADHLHYGSDYPFTPEFAVRAARDRLAEVAAPLGLVDLLHSNTERLFPSAAERP